MSNGPGALPELCAELCVSAGHPMLAGHFPGDPIVPGAWLLAWVVAAATRQLAIAGESRSIAGVKRVKFSLPLRPDQLCDCALRAATDSMRFTITQGTAVIASGSLNLKPND